MIMQIFLTLSILVAVAADHNYLQGTMYLGNSCSGEGVHYFVWVYDKPGSLGAPGSGSCGQVRDQNGATAYGNIQITGAYTTTSGTGAYTILGSKFSDSTCSIESYGGSDTTIVPTGQCTSLGTMSYEFEYHDSVPLLPAGRTFLVEAFYESNTVCLSDSANGAAIQLSKYSYGRAFSLDKCIPSGGGSAMYTSGRQLLSYSAPDCTGTPSSTQGVPDVMLCNTQSNTDAYPGTWESSSSASYAPNSQYHFQKFVTVPAGKIPKTTKAPKAGKSKPKGKE